jgi:integrase
LVLSDLESPSPGLAHASLLIDSGANPKAIQQFMGHSKIQTTFDVYGHLLPGSYDDIRARMDAYLAAAA